ncbi:MAG: D-amino acid aminotransferase [Ruminococcaceae bacterium]|nr:D-amino acid aminotransferase [Oscillospiraceae bacterium]
MKTLGYYDGRIDELDRISVPMLDRACYFGDGVYDVTYSRNYHIFALEGHIDHFFQSAELISIRPPFTKGELAELLESLVKRMDNGNLWVYFQLSRSADPRTHAFPATPKPRLWVMLKPAEIRDTYAPMRCISMEDTRFYHCNVKSLNLLPNVLATQAATAAGADECILHRGSTVTECAHSNLSILKNGALITHPANEMIYAGTGRAHLIEQCVSHGIAVEERTYTMEELWNADEVLVTSASALCAPVIQLDGKPIGGKAPHTVRLLQDALLREYLEQTK